MFRGLLFKISVDDGGTGTVDLVSTPPTPARQPRPAVPNRLQRRVLRTMIGAGMQAAMRFFSGKLKVSGDPTLATRLTKLLQMAQ